MYKGNGVVTEFPLPDGTDGESVYLSPPSGRPVKLLRGSGYVIEDGSVVFVTPPPSGWDVLFSLEEKAASGAIDPVELVAEMRAMHEYNLQAVDAANKRVEEAKKFADKVVENVTLSALESEKRIDAKIAEIKAEDAEVIRAEVARGVEEAAEYVGKHLVEIRNKHKDVMGVDMAAMVERAEAAASVAGEAVRAVDVRIETLFAAKAAVLDEKIREARDVLAKVNAEKEEAEKRLARIVGFADEAEARYDEIARRLDYAAGQVEELSRRKADALETLVGARKGTIFGKRSDADV